MAIEIASTFPPVVLPPFLPVDNGIDVYEKIHSLVQASLEAEHSWTSSLMFDISTDPVSIPTILDCSLHIIVASQDLFHVATNPLYRCVIRHPNLPKVPELGSFSFNVSNFYSIPDQESEILF